METNADISFTNTVVLRNVFIAVPGGDAKAEAAQGARLLEDDRLTTEEPT